jgi:hypothetical protein
MMRLLVLLIVLFSMPVLAADHAPWPDGDAQPAGIELLAQAAPPGQPGGQPDAQPQGGQQQNKRYPGDYCTRHCRHNEIPCGDECLAAKDGKAARCTKKVTTTCAGKP